MATPALERIDLTSADGTPIAAYAVGPRGAPEILFIHGFNQCHLSWERQLCDPSLARTYRMVALDLRGHGASGKPEDPACYTEDKRWADDIAAVIAAAGLKRPVLVGWSYGGRVITDYLRHHGFAGLAGINFVAAYTSTDEALHGPGFKHFANMMSEDLTTSIAATQAFARACFERQPTAADFEVILAYNMMVPPRLRAAIRNRSHNPGDLLPTLRLPVLVTHGDRDQLSLPRRAHYTASRAPNAFLSMYEGIGHAPFWEDAARYNRELADFLRKASAG